MSGDILKDLAAEHADIRRMFSAYTGMPFHDSERKQLIQRGLAENTEIESLLGELGHSDQDTAGFARLVAQLVERATAHANREEAQLLPAAWACTCWTT